jgi:hypothetical protein
MDECSIPTLERISELVKKYADMRGRTQTEVARALLGTKTLKKHGYTDRQQGRLTEVQGQAAIAVLEYWIGAANEHQPRMHHGQPDS